MLSTGRPIYNNYNYKLSERNAASSTDTEDLYRTSQIARQIVDNTAYAYTYDVLGNITAITKGVRTNPDTDSTATSGYTAYRSYEYDALGQLERENNATTGVTTTWSYDVLGNIESAIRYGYTTGSVSGLKALHSVDYVYGSGGTGWNRVLTALNHYQWQTISGVNTLVLTDTEHFAYDAIGNPTTYRDNTLTWDGRQMASYNGIQYTYDADGIRATKTDGTTRTEYFYVGDKLVYQAVSDTATGAMTYELYFFYDSYNHLTAIRYVTETLNHYYYVTTNLQGDVLGIYTAGGVLLASYEYDAWGNCTTTSHNANYIIGELNPIRYRGYYYDAETGLYYCNSRYYDPEIGRWLNADAFVSTGQGVLGYNMFAYCGNNPITYSDPTGRFSINSLFQKTKDMMKDFLKSFIKDYSESPVDAITGAAPSVVAGITYKLSKGWSCRIDAENTSTKVKRHIHVSKGGKEYAQNRDGEPHDGSTGTPPESVLKELKETVGWDWKQKARSWANKNNYYILHYCPVGALDSGNCACSAPLIGYGPFVNPVVSGNPYALPMPAPYQAPIPWVPLPVG